MFGGWEIIAIVALLFLLFGASRLPQLAKSLGQSRKAFKEGLEEAEKELTGEGEMKTIDSPDAPKITSMSDDDLAAEMRRRAEAKQS
jgi:sec-independent protein translocase protein TatA